MNLLSIDTSTEIMSLAIQCDSGLYTYSQKAGLSHSEALLPQILELSKKAGLSLKEFDLVIVGAGPGSFTGLRIGMSTAKGISQGAGCPLVSLSTLDVYGQMYKRIPGAVLPVIDAKKKQFFTALYIEGQRKGEILDETPENILALARQYSPITICGPDSKLFASRINLEQQWLDTNYLGTVAVKLLELGLEKWKADGADPEDSAPIYIRKSEAEIHLEKKKYG